MTTPIMDCPDCDGSVAAADMHDGDTGVMRAMALSCPDCGASVLAGQLFYPDERFVIIAPAVSAVTCATADCDATPVWRTQPVDEPVSASCAAHTPRQLERAASFRGRVVHDG